MKDKIIVVLSCILMVALGSAYITQQWTERGRVAKGVKFSVFYSAIIIAAHIAAYRKRGRQSMADSIPCARAVVSDPASASPEKTLDYAPRDEDQPKHQMHLVVILTQQLALLVLSSWILDGGGCFGFCSVMILVFWGLAGVIWCFKSTPLSRVEAFLLNYGFVPLMIAIVILMAGVLWVVEMFQ